MSDQADVYRGYLLVRLAKIGTEWDITKKMMDLKATKKLIFSLFFLYFILFVI